MADELELGNDLVLRGPSPEQRRAAALAVCDRATDVDDARALLDALGLLDHPGLLRPPPAPGGGSAGPRRLPP